MREWRLVMLLWTSKSRKQADTGSDWSSQRPRDENRKTKAKVEHLAIFLFLSTNPTYLNMRFIIDFIS
jgi:hypothetical protein